MYDDRSSRTHCSTKESDRATIDMTHGNSGLRVTEEEAMRVEKENAKRLLKLRKLSLVLDLDHTVIHATTMHHQVNRWIMQVPSDHPNAGYREEIFSFTLDNDPQQIVYYVKQR